MPDSQRPDGLIDRPLSPLAAALWAVALTLTVTVAVAATESARPGARSDVVNLAMCQVLATSAVVFGMMRFHAADASLRAVLGLRPIAPLHVLLSIAAGAGLFPLMSMIDGAIVRRWPIDAEATESLQKVLASSSRGALVVAALVVVPLTHELFFRGILYTGVRAAINARTAILATAVFYACSNLDPQQIPTALALGLALAWLRERSGTVLAPVLAQLAYGAVEGIPILRGRDLQVEVTYPIKWVAGGALIAALALAAIGAGQPSRRTDEAGHD